MIKNLDIIVATIFFLVMSKYSFAVVIELKDGTRVEGSIFVKHESYLKIHLNDGTGNRKIYKSEIARILKSFSKESTGISPCPPEGNENLATPVENLKSQVDNTLEEQKVVPSVPLYLDAVIREFEKIYPQIADEFEKIRIPPLGKDHLRKDGLKNTEYFYLTKEQLQKINKQLEGGGNGEPKTPEADEIGNAVDAPRFFFGGKEMYHSLAEKASVLALSIAQGHPFRDGNKRTASYAILAFLKKNGFEISKKHLPSFLEKVNSLADHLHDKETENRRVQLAKWLDEHKMSVLLQNDTNRRRRTPDFFEITHPRSRIW